MQIPFRIAQRTLVLIAIPIAFQILFVCVLLDLLHQSEVETASEQHAKEVIYEANALNSSFTDAGFAMGGYSITKNAWFLRLYREIAATVPARFSTLSALIADNQQQREILKELESDWQSMSGVLNVAEQAVEGRTVKDKPIDEKQLYAELRAGKARLNSKVTELVAANQNIQQKMPGLKMRSRKRFVLYLICGVVVSTILTISLAYLFNLEMKRKLKLLADNTVRLASGLELAAPIGGNDEIALLDKTFHSMANELADAAHKEKEILNNARDVICSIDQKGRITKINSACQENWGYSSEELTGSNFLTLTPPEDREGLWAAFNAVRSEGAPSSVEGRIVTKAHDLRHVLWSLNWSPTQPTCYCVAHDMTEKKQLERLKQDFVDMVSHDLRSPLTSIRLTLGLLAEGAFGDLSTTAVDQVQMTEAQTTRLIAMINDLLDIERLESGRLELHCETLATGEIIGKAVDTVRPQLEEKRLVVKVPSTHFSVFADEERLIQVLVNLMSNAIKFSREGDVIAITTKRGPDWVEFAVSDRGRGIPAENQQAVFERFKQLDKGGSQLKNGFGLGLPICKMIVDQHGGSIGLESKENEGSKFWFRIPDNG